jgi:hypothetical protein
MYSYHFSLSCHFISMTCSISTRGRNGNGYLGRRLRQPQRTIAGTPGSLSKYSKQCNPHPPCIGRMYQKQASLDMPAVSGPASLENISPPPHTLDAPRRGAAIGAFSAVM